jgi:predicted RNase H-like nuclease (RuvC/YqgF family)
MSSGGREGLDDWIEQNVGGIRQEREKLERRLHALTAEIKKLEAQREQMLVSREEQKDPELNPEYELMMERGIARVTNKRAELKQRQSEMTKRLNALEHEEQQLMTVLRHERFGDWVLLKKRRDETAAELAQIDAELRQLLESMTRDLQAE